MYACSRTKRIFQITRRQRQRTEFWIWILARLTPTNFSLMAHVNRNAGYHWVCVPERPLGGRRPGPTHHGIDERCVVHSRCEVSPSVCFLSLVQWKTTTFQSVQNKLSCHIYAYESTDLILQFHGYSGPEILSIRIPDFYSGTKSHTTTKLGQYAKLFLIWNWIWPLLCNSLIRGLEYSLSLKSLVASL